MSWPRRLLRLGALFLLFACVAAEGHQLRLAYLELQETSGGRYAVLWQTPAASEELRLRLRLQLPTGCQRLGESQRSYQNGALAERWHLHCADGLLGQRIGVEGLAESSADVLLRVQPLDGPELNVRLNSAVPQYLFAVTPAVGEVASSYLRLGIEHILGGLDHLLFVFTLLLIVRGCGRLLATISAFTLAHSITLGLATLGLVSLPSQPVEAVIALSIIFVALEVLRLQRGEGSVTARQPWVVAFAFGLLHGFGFAGALEEIGIPHERMALALVCFNLGVEGGQLLFIGAVLALRYGMRRLHWQITGWLLRLPPYAVGSLAMTWLLQRVS